MSRDFTETQETSMLRGEMEILMSEYHSLLDVTGAAAVFVAKLDYAILPDEVCKAANLLSEALNNLSEEILCDALQKVEAELAVGE